MSKTGIALVDFLLEPGSSTRLIPWINLSLVALLGLLGALFASGQGNMHVAIMAFLACGLMLSVNWFLQELNRVQSNENGDGEAERQRAKHD